MAIQNVSMMAGSPVVLQQQLARDPQSALAQKLIDEGSSTAPVQSPLEGLARALTGIVGAYTQRSLKDKYAGEAKDYQDTLSRALMAGSGSGDTFDSATGKWSAPTNEPNPDLMAKVLMGNPLTAPLALEQRMKEIDDVRSLNRALRIEEAKKAGEPPKIRERKDGGNIITEEWDAPSKTWKAIGTSPQFKDAGEDRQLVEIYDPTSPTGTRMVPRSEAANQPGKPPASMMEITGYDENGRPLIQVGGRSTPGGLQKPTLNKIEEKQFNAMEGLSRLNNIMAEFNPDFLTYGANWKALTSNVREKAGFKLDPKDAQFVKDFGKFKQNTIGNVNRTLNELSGAAVSPAEAERLRAELPDAGTGLFDGDGPTEFKAKLDNASRNMKRAIIRYNLSRTLGKDPLKSGIELTDVDGLVNERGAQLEQTFRAQNQNADPETIKLMVSEQLRRELGVGQ